MKVIMKKGTGQVATSGGALFTDFDA